MMLHMFSKLFITTCLTYYHCDCTANYVGVCLQLGYCREMHDSMYNIKMSLVALCFIFMYICTVYPRYLKFQGTEQNVSSYQ